MEQKWETSPQPLRLHRDWKDLHPLPCLMRKSRQQSSSFCDSSFLLASKWTVSGFSVGNSFLKGWSSEAERETLTSKNAGNLCSNAHSVSISQISKKNSFFFFLRRVPFFVLCCCCCCCFLPAGNSLSWYRLFYHFCHWRSLKCLETVWNVDIQSYDISWGMLLNCKKRRKKCFRNAKNKNTYGSLTYLKWNSLRANRSNIAKMPQNHFKMQVSCSNTSPFVSVLGWLYFYLNSRL